MRLCVVYVGYWTQHTYKHNWPVNCFRIGINNPSSSTSVYSWIENYSWLIIWTSSPDPVIVIQLRHRVPFSGSICRAVPQLLSSTLTHLNNCNLILCKPGKILIAPTFSNDGLGLSSTSLVTIIPKSNSWQRQMPNDVFSASTHNIKINYRFHACLAWLSVGPYLFKYSLGLWD